MIKINTPITTEIIKKLKPKDRILLSGHIITARDQAHKKLCRLISSGRPLPVALKDAIIYYVGPTAAAKNMVIGSCGPTTSSRMDNFTIPLIKNGVRAFIGKGRRSELVRKAIKNNKCVYFLAPSGLGALLSQYVVSKKCLAFKELGPEAIYELTVENFPLIVGIDSQGHDIYDKEK